MILLLGGLLFWLHRHPEDRQLFEIRKWPGVVRRSGWPRSLELTEVSWAIITLLVIMPLVIGFAIALGRGAPLVNPEVHPAAVIAGSSIILALIVFAILPVWEELIFRRLIQHHLSARIGVPAGILLAALAFGLFHLANAGTYAWAWFPPFVAGLYFGFIFWRHGLRGAILAHSGYNVAAILLAVFG